MMSKRISLTIFVLVFSFLTFYACPSSWALILTPGEDFNFNFNNPGARSNAMGGAFVGVADDATAAFTNPAGLTVLNRPEVSVEFKHTELETNTYVGGGALTVTKDIDQSSTFASFVSGVLPLGKTTLAVYRHKLLDIEQEFEWSDPLGLNLIGLQSNTDIEVITHGISMGIKLSDTFSAGLSLGFSQLDFYSLNLVFFDPAYTRPEWQSGVVDSTDNSEQYNLAFLWNPFSEFNIGIAYRYGPEFETSFLGRDNSTAEEIRFRNTLKIPDVYSLGISYRYYSVLTAAVDVNYVKYSDLKKNLIFRDGQASDIEIDDTTEVHAGLEYTFELSETPFALRCGYFYMPQHNFVYVGPVTNTTQAYWAGVYQERDDEHIFSVGFGFVSFGNLQIDVAGSIGDKIKEYSASIVYRFD
jgi:long-subunit fatty acid transport protein